VITWIIDGNNLMHRDPRLRAILQQSGFEAARRFLEAELGRRRQGGAHFHVIYDGGTGSRPSRVATDVAQSGQSADDQILRLARERGGRGESLRVVTSDFNDIGSRLSGLSVEWVSVEAFRQVLWGQSRRDVASGEDRVEEKPRPPRGKEVDRWLQIFEDDKPGEDHHGDR